MLAAQIRVRRRTAEFLDATSILAAFLLAHQVWNSCEPPQVIAHHAWILPLVVSIGCGLNARLDLHRSLPSIGESDVAIRVLKAHAVGAVAGAALLFLVDPDDIFFPRRRYRC